MKLEDLGYNDQLKQSEKDNNSDAYESGRVVAEHKERYIVKTPEGEFEAEITGNMRFTATTREDFPAVGDWVKIIIYDNDFAIIHKILPRSSILKRQAAGMPGEVQVIATNIDAALLVQSADRDFNINRLERYLTICHSSKIKPVIVLSKTDLTEKKQILEMTGNIKKRIKDIPVIPISNMTKDGIDKIEAILEKGKTYCILGSSGVGKSTLINTLAGKTIMQTNALSLSTKKGKHTTSRRELIILPGGAILIDNPGMKEIGIADLANGLETTFDIVFNLSQHCKFKNCTHTTETGCSVLEAVAEGKLDKNSYMNYLKMEREKAHFESTIAERREKDKKFAKILKNYNKDIRRSI